MAFAFVIMRHLSPTIKDAISAHGEIISIVIAMAVVGFLFCRVYRKHVNGLLVSIEFDEFRMVTTIELMSIMNGAISKKSVPYENINVEFSEKKDNVRGKQVIARLKDKELLLHELNIHQAAWCRHNNIDIIIERLRRFSR